MERLTQDTDYCVSCCNDASKQVCNYWTGNAVQKCRNAQIYETLRNYERMKLTPEQISTWITQWQLIQPSLDAMIKKTEGDGYIFLIGDDAKQVIDRAVEYIGKLESYISIMHG